MSTPTPQGFHVSSPVDSSAPAVLRDELSFAAPTTTCIVKGANSASAGIRCLTHLDDVSLLGVQSDSARAPDRSAGLCVIPAAGQLDSLARKDNK
jgi:hypothetical protein